MRDLDTIAVKRTQPTSWKQGELAPVWAELYPELFDSDDVRLAASQGEKGYHFFEWLGAIILHHATGYQALIGKYEFTNHARKQKVVEDLLPAGVVELLRDRVVHGRAQAPDLLMYAPDRSSYFFCEVKGPADRVSNAQESKFEALGRLAGRDVCLLRFAWFSEGSAALR